MILSIYICIKGKYINVRGGEDSETNVLAVNEGKEINQSIDSCWSEEYHA